MSEGSVWKSDVYRADTGPMPVCNCNRCVSARARKTLQWARDEHKRFTEALTSCDKGDPEYLTLAAQIRTLSSIMVLLQ